MVDPEQEILLDADRPSTERPDLYNRRPFVRRLSQAVAQRPGREPFIIGIEGTWGEGKTTVLEYMAQELEANHDKVTLVRFNPWVYPTEEQMMLGLVQDINQRLRFHQGSRVQKVIGRLANFTGGVASLIGGMTGNNFLEKGGGAAKTWGATLLEGPNLATLKSDLENALRDSDLQIVVLVDDLDRLDHDSIRSVFRLLKAVFDLPSFTYILAYDPSIIAAALETNFGVPGQMSGRKYMEKIVQLPLALPKLDPVDLEEDLRNTLFDAIQENAVEVEEEEALAVHRLARSLAQGITTPREIRRLGNAVKFALPILRGETDPINVCRVEALRVLYPSEFTKVVNNVALITSKSSGSMAFEIYKWRNWRNFSVLGSSKPEPNADLIALFNSTSSIARDLLVSLFPLIDMDLYLSQQGHFHGDFPVYDTNFVGRYLQHAIPTDDIGDAEVSSYLSDIQSGISTRRRWMTLKAGKRLPRFLTKLRYKAETLKNEDRQSLLLDLAREYYGEHPDYHPGPFSIRQALIELLESGASSTVEMRRAALFETVLRALPEWWMALDLFHAGSYLFAGERQEGIGDEQKTVRAWLASLVQARGPELFTDRRIDPVKALLLLEEKEGKAATESRLLTFLDGGANPAHEWLHALARSVRAAGHPSPGEFSLDQYLKLAKVTDPDLMLAKLRQWIPNDDAFAPSGDPLSAAMLWQLEKKLPDVHEIMARRSAVPAPPPPSEESRETE